jgi:predicted RNase H-like nuclease (RuvC/YqgF family)
MMPSASGSLDPGSIDVEAVDSIDGPPPRPTASADDRSNADDRPAADRRVRDHAPAADRDIPENRVERLADEVAALEAEVAALEAEIESKERQRQQVIDNYESIVRKRSASPERSEEDSTAETEAAATEHANGGLLAAVGSRLARLVGRADE